MPFMKKAALFCLLIALVAWSAACTQEAGEPPVEDYQQLMAKGGQALAAGDVFTAADAYSRALDVRPADGPASLGMTLTDLLSIVQMDDETVSFVVNLLSADTLAQGNEGGLAPGSTIDDTLHHFIKQILEKQLDEINLRLDDALADPDLVLNLQAVPIVFQGEELLDLGGEWDAADVLWLTSLVRLIEGAVDFLQGTNLNMDVGPLLASDLVSAIVGGDVDYQALLDELVVILRDLLRDPDYPDFLLPKPDEMWRFARSQRNFALATVYAVNVWPQVDAEADDQTDDLLAYTDANGNGRRDANEPYRFLGEDFPAELMSALPAARAVGWHLFLALADQTDLDTDAQTRQTFDPADLNMILASLGLPSLIAADRWDLAEFFAAPPMDDVKDFAVDALSCTIDNDDASAAWACLLNLLGVF